MKINNKGKVHPSPSSSSSSCSSSSSSSVGVNRDGDVLSVFKLLPVAILALVSILSLEDREVLAYMITKSMKTTTTTNASSFVQESKKKSSKKPPKNNNNNNHTNHKTPVFDCDCFECYTSYWVRWDSSPNRELIHQAIEAFEDHLTNGELSRKNTRAKRRDKTGRRVGENPPLLAPGQPEVPVLGPPTISSPPPVETHQTSVLAVVSHDDDVSPVVTPEKAADREEEKAKEVEEAKLYDKAPEAGEETAVVVRTHVAVNNHKGLARKVLPDVLGLLNSRLWSLWSPNV